MKAKSKLISSVLILASTFGMSAYQVKAASPLTSKIIETINKSADANAAQDALCKQGGVIRGSGFTAGNNCKTHDIALIFINACKNYKDAMGSKCAKNATGILSGFHTSVDATLAAAPTDLLNTAKVKGSDAAIVLCTASRAKLPQGLRRIADETCQTFKLLVPAQAKLVDDLKKDRDTLQKLSRPLGQAPQEILARSTRDVKKDLNDILHKIETLLAQIEKREVFAKDDEFSINALMLQSKPFIQKLETMGLRVNAQNGTVEMLNSKTSKWEPVR